MVPAEIAGPSHRAGAEIGSARESGYSEPSPGLLVDLGGSPRCYSQIGTAEL